MLWIDNYFSQGLLSTQIFCSGNRLVGLIQYRTLSLGYELDFHFRADINLRQSYLSKGKLGWCYLQFIIKIFLKIAYMQDIHQDILNLSNDKLWYEFDFHFGANAILKHSNLHNDKLSLWRWDCLKMVLPVKRRSIQKSFKLNHSPGAQLWKCQQYPCNENILRRVKAVYW